MNYNDVMKSLSELGNNNIKKRYMSLGAKEPLFGVTISSMKPLAKKLENNNELAEELYNSGNYDAMYLAGMIINPNSLSEEDFERWIDKAYFPMLADFTVAIVLSESKHATKIAKKWIASKEEMKISAGYSTYAWLIGYKKDDELDLDEIDELLDNVREHFNKASETIENAMNTVLVAVGISYKPLHEKALEIAKEIATCGDAVKQIETATLKGRLGFKRKNVRC